MKLFMVEYISFKFLMYKLLIVLFLLSTSLSFAQPFQTHAVLSKVIENSDSAVYEFSFYPSKNYNLYIIELSEKEF